MPLFSPYRNHMRNCCTKRSTCTNFQSVCIYIKRIIAYNFLFDFNTLVLTEVQNFFNDYLGIRRYLKWYIGTLKWTAAEMCTRFKMVSLHTLGKVPGSLRGHDRRRATFQFGCLHQYAECWAEQRYAVIEHSLYSITQRGLYFLCLHDQISVFENFLHL